MHINNKKVYFSKYLVLFGQELTTSQSNNGSK